MIFYTPRHSVGNQPTHKSSKKYDAARNDFSTSQMSVKKIFERSVKNSRLGGDGLCVGAISRV
ncbi:MAG: hypothetical protein IK117_11300 [Bacteroidales bacterium]|nr:hypothetical protein [Bacteroidales bacterium]